MFLIPVVVAALLVASALGRCACVPARSGGPGAAPGSPAPPEKASPQSEPLVWVGSMDCIARACQKPLESAPELRAAFSGMRVVDHRDPLFPDDAQLALNAARSVPNPPLAIYAALNPDARSFDLFLLDVSGDAYWPTVLADGSRVDRFKCDFVLHLSPAPAPDGKPRTRIDVIEYIPRVDAGKTFGVGPHGPGPKRDIRDAAPTNQDRTTVLDAIKAVLARECPASH